MEGAEIQPADPQQLQQQLAAMRDARDLLQQQLNDAQNQQLANPPGPQSEVDRLCGLVELLLTDRANPPARDTGRDKPPELIKLEKGNIHDWRNCVEAFFGYKRLDSILTDPYFDDKEAKHRAISSIRATLRGGDIDTFRMAAEGASGSVAAGMEALKQHREGSPQIRKVSLLAQVWRFKFEPRESPRDAAQRMRELAAQLKQCGYELLDEEHQALAMVFAGLSDRDMTVQTRNFMGLGLELTLQNVISALDTTSKSGTYLTVPGLDVPGAMVAETPASHKRPPDAEANAAGPAKRSRGAARGGRGDQRGRGGRGGAGRKQMECYNCGGVGHMKRDCSKPCQNCGSELHFTTECPSQRGGASGSGRGRGRGRGRTAFAGASTGLHKGKGKNVSLEEDDNSGLGKLT